ncbi:MAG: hypothetical protein WCF93_01665 [Candidatus Moraniibacteriota bacterium]
MISKETFDTEISLCRKMYKKKSGCAWGRCENCAATLLLHKLYCGEIIENGDAVAKFKENILK